MFQPTEEVNIEIVGGFVGLDQDETGIDQSTSRSSSDHPGFILPEEFSPSDKPIGDPLPPQENNQKEQDEAGGGKGQQKQDDNNEDDEIEEVDTSSATTNNTENKGTGKLGLFGLTMNACAMIAPGAFLWTTLQIQAATAVANAEQYQQPINQDDIWFGIVFALLIAFLTAIPYSELSRKYPEAGCGGAYYFAEKAFSSSPFWRKGTRIIKFFTACVGLLFYFLFPGVMLSFLAIMIGALFSQSFGADSMVAQVVTSMAGQTLIVCVFAGLTCLIIIRGVSGTTKINIAINIIQWIFLIIFCAIALFFRWLNPLELGSSEWVHISAIEIVQPHLWVNIEAQSAVAILILVGFESATSMGAEAENPKRDIPRAVLLSLTIQGIFCYLLQYFATEYMVNNQLTTVDEQGRIVAVGYYALAQSSSPIGDLLIQAINGFFGGGGLVVWILFAITVIIAVIGAILSSMNTSANMTLAVALDRELPAVLARLHSNYQTPYVSILVLTLFSALSGAVGCFSVEALTALAKASNLGTFLLYAVICFTTLICFSASSSTNSQSPDLEAELELESELEIESTSSSSIILSSSSSSTTLPSTRRTQKPCDQCGKSCMFHALFPTIGIFLNLLMVWVIFRELFMHGPDASFQDKLSIILASAWMGIFMLYFIIDTLVKKKPFLYHHPDEILVLGAPQSSEGDLVPLSDNPECPLEGDAINNEKEHSQIDDDNDHHHDHDRIALQHHRLPEREEL